MRLVIAVYAKLKLIRLIFNSLTKYYFAVEEMCSLIFSTCAPYSIQRKKRFYFCSNKPEGKTADGEQKEDLECQLAAVASQAEESPACAPTEDKEPTQNQENLTETVSAEPQHNVSPPNTVRTHSGRGRPPKATPVSAPKKTSVMKEEESAAKDVPGFQDDPSDTDYTPSKSISFQLSYNLSIWHVPLFSFLFDQ